MKKNPLIESWHLKFSIGRLTLWQNNSKLYCLFLYNCLSLAWGIALKKKKNLSLHWQTPATRGQEEISVTMSTCLRNSSVRWTKPMSLPRRSPSSLEPTPGLKTICLRGRSTRLCAEERGCRWWGTFNSNEISVNLVECVCDLKI